MIDVVWENDLSSQSIPLSIDPRLIGRRVLYVAVTNQSERVDTGLRLSSQCCRLLNGPGGHCDPE